jgi:hypothetical protein
MDPTAYRTNFDEQESKEDESQEGVKKRDGMYLLERAFHYLKYEAGAIVGGMLSGAMGGGIMMCVRHPTATDDHIEQAIDMIRQWTVGGEVRPLEQLERIHYRINDRGLTYCHFQ